MASVEEKGAPPQPSESGPTSDCLAADKYRERLEAHQVSLSRSALVILALVAFWLAMEGGYARFEEGKEALVSRTLLSAALSKASQAEWSRQQKSEFATPGGGAKKTPPRQQELGAPGKAPVAAPMAAADAATNQAQAPADDPKIRESAAAHSATSPAAKDNATAAQGVQSAAELKAEIGEINRKLEELRRASVTLSIAGTNLPPQLSLAPVVWLAALAVWLMYFDVKRSSAHLNLFAYHRALPPGDRRKLGGAGEGALWLAPLPEALPKGLISPDEETLAPLDDETLQEVRSLIGWDKHTEPRYRAALLFIALLIAAIALRVAWIGIDLTSAPAVVLKIVGPFWKIAGPVLVVSLVMVSGIYLTQLTTTAGQTRNVAASIPVSRRAVLGGGVATLIFGGLFAQSRDWLPKNLLSRIGPSGGRKAVGLKRPRFVSEEQKQARLARYRILAIPSDKGVGREGFYRSLRASPRSRKAKSWMTIHAADGKGRIRLFSAADAIPQMKALSADLLLKHISNVRPQNSGEPPLEKLPVNANATTAFELAAMKHLRVAVYTQPGALRVSPLIQACNILRGGVLACLEGNARKPNLRLLDLLAGLAVRYDMPGRLNDLISLLSDERFAAVRSSWLAKRKGQTIDPVEQRIGTWRNPDSKWRQRWATEKRRWELPSEAVVALEIGDFAIYRRKESFGKPRRPLKRSKSLMLPRPNRVTRIP
ncbi:MAG TPA: hypothetical protein VFP12_05185 [Allosphingosinicella sp.]|nr:hypothetical protein [Allosphingosinicella sp.]